MSALMRVIQALAPAGYWPLDEASGTVAYDKSGNGNNGTYVNSPGLASRTPPLATMRPFCDFVPGSTHYVNLGTPAALNFTTGYTMLAIALMDTSLADTTLIAEGYNGSTVQFQMSSPIGTTGAGSTVGKMGIGHFGASAWKFVQSTTTIALGTYYMWVGTFDGTNCNIYTNGALEVSTAKAAISSGEFATICIGARMDSGAINTNNKWDGAIGHVALWSTALTAAQISLIYREYLRSGVVTG